MNEYLIPFDNCSREHINMLGGKNANLGELASIGVPVPPGFAISVKAYREVLRFNNLDQSIKDIISKTNPDDSDSTLRSSQQIRQLFSSAKFPDSLRAEIQDLYCQLQTKCGLDNLPVAVRSSAVEEDAPDASFAGQHETYLWVRGVDNVLSKVAECFSSLFTPRAIAYRVSKGFNVAESAISVGVQKMVHPRAAGVIFTLNPLTGDRSRICIESVWGVGETLVGGEVDPDSFLDDKAFFSIKKREIRKKLVERVVDEAEGTKKIELDESRQCEPSLADECVVELAKMSHRIERYYQRPMDIEFCVEKQAKFPDNLFIVQARPETIWSRKKKEEVKLSPIEYIAKDLQKGIRL